MLSFLPTNANQIEGFAERLFASHPFAVLVVDLIGHRIVSANDSAKRLIGDMQEPNALAGAPIDSVITLASGRMLATILDETDANATGHLHPPAGVSGTPRAVRIMCQSLGGGWASPDHRADDMTARQASHRVGQDPGGLAVVVCEPNAESRGSVQPTDTESDVRRVLNLLPQPVWMAEPKGSVDFANDVLHAYAGRPPEAFLDLGWEGIIHPDDTARAREHWADAVAEARPFISEIRMRRADDEYRWHLVAANPSRDDRAVIVKWYGVAVDVHDRKMAEGALRLSEERFEAVARANTDVIWDWDIDAGTLWWSDQITRVFGYTLEETAPGPDFWESRIHQDDHDRVIAGVNRAIAGNDEYWEDEYRYYCKDGSLIEVEDCGSILRDESGRAVRIIGGVADVTERRRTQRALAERVKELRCLHRVLEATIDDRRMLADICRSVVRILPEGIVHSEQAVARIVLNGDEYRHADWLDPAATLNRPIASDDQILGFVEVAYPAVPAEPWAGAGVFLDEEGALLEGVAIHLARVWESRRMRDQLAQSERLKSVGELTGGVAHDFNNLLTVVMGSAEVLVDELDDRPELKCIAETALMGARRGAELTDRLLAFARRQALDPEAVDVAQLLREMSGLLTRSLGDHIQVDIILPPADEAQGGLWPALIDRSQLENAVLNLGINARDAMRDGGRLTIEVGNVQLDESYTSLESDVSPGDYVMIAVSDSGTGMSREVVKRAFDPFFTTKAHGKGSGLGLSMVFGFVKQSNGHVKIYSEPGQGTTVRMYLPRAAGDDRVDAAVLPEATTEFGTETILLVEDNDLVRDHVSQQLKSLGYAVLVAETGPDALDLMKRSPHVDLLFTDVVLPGGMNGRVLADHARSMRPGLPVLYTSGYTETAIVHGGQVDPGVHLLSKPYRRQDLAAKIRFVLDER